MARPREIKLEQGTVYLNGFTAEVANALSEHIKDFKFEPSSLVGTTMELIPTEMPSLNSSALSEKAIATRISKVSGKAQFVTVLYNGETKEAVVGEIRDCDGLRDASTRFKIAAGNLGFV